MLTNANRVSEADAPNLIRRRPPILRIKSENAQSDTPKAMISASQDKKIAIKTQSIRTIP